MFYPEASYPQSKPNPPPTDYRSVRARHESRPRSISLLNSIHAASARHREYLIWTRMAAVSVKIRARANSTIGNRQGQIFNTRIGAEVRGGFYGSGNRSRGLENHCTYRSVPVVSSAGDVRGGAAQSRPLL